jgi:heparosan-N-sulfate-glucuronate 5-epimerase
MIRGSGTRVQAGQSSFAATADHSSALSTFRRAYAAITASVLRTRVVRMAWRRAGLARQRARRIQVDIPLPYDRNGQYLDFASMPTIGAGPRTRLDSRGIPLVKYGETWAHNPVTAAQRGLQQFSRWTLDGVHARLEDAVSLARWLCETQDSETGMWSYNFDFPVGGFGTTLERPWHSAMAQGQAMSLLTRVHQATNDRSFLQAARAACSPLDHGIREGGLRADFFGHPYFEEYPTDPPSFTLNGFMFTLLGLYDLAQDDTAAADLLQIGMGTLVYCLPFYDTRSTSAYHLGHITNPPRQVHSSKEYHALHLKQLRALNSVRPNQTLSYYARMWSNP